MSEEWHDPELCRRLALNVMGWEPLKSTYHIGYNWSKDGESVGLTVEDGKGGAYDWDPCCNPAHNWMLEQRMEELGWEYIWDNNLAHFFTWLYPETMFRRKLIESPKLDGANRLHATALASWAAIGEEE